MYAPSSPHQLESLETTDQADATGKGGHMCVRASCRSVSFISLSFFTVY